MNELMKTLNELIEAHFNEYVEVETYENGDHEAWATIFYFDGGEGESAEITLRKNEYGVITYEYDGTWFDSMNEIVTCESCHDCWSDCPFNDKTEEERNEIVKKDIKEWKSKPKIEFELLRTKITIHPEVIEVTCHVGMSHKHLYRGYTVKFETNNRKTFESLMNIRDILANPSIFFLNKNHDEPKTKDKKKPSTISLVLAYILAIVGLSAVIVFTTIFAGLLMFAVAKTILQAITWIKDHVFFFIS